jgi:hypothetical protein
MSKSPKNTDRCTNRAQPPKAERNAAGRFEKGNTVGRLGGRPRKEIEAEYMRNFYEAFSQSELAAVSMAVIEEAKGGNIAAARLLFDHAIGRPIQRLEASVETEEYRVAGVPPEEHKREMMQLFADGLKIFHVANQDQSSAKPPKKSRRKSSKKPPTRKAKQSVRNSK